MPFGQIHYNAPGDNFEEFVEYVAATGFDCIEVMIDSTGDRTETGRIAGLLSKTVEISTPLPRLTGSGLS